MTKRQSGVPKSEQFTDSTEIVLESGNSRAVVKPADDEPRGGALVTEWKVGGNDIYFPDTQRYGSRRGGCPILFPIAGKFERELPGVELPQHGFGRDLPWAVEQSDERGIVLALESNEKTAAIYRYPFRARYSVTTIDSGLIQRLEVENRGTEPMPLAPGFHPYFRVEDARKRDIEIDFEDYSSGVFSHDQSETYDSQEVVHAHIPGTGTVQLVSEGFPFWTLWTEPGRDFVCIEPRFRAKDLDDPKERLTIEPGETAVLGTQTRVIPET
ncbi:MAG: hypothetical protein Q8Q11_00365 [bacterium]|nr:hypothetical protein [bacterium]MDZ4248176.1 hypothetical protein [Patescibacteria group bacterium]